jgi:scyllo-inositol 2-dehydrogenase (NAD+)
MKQKLRLGFIGCGNMASRHAGNAAGIDGVEFAAFCSRGGDHAEQLRAEYGQGYVTTDAKKVLMDENIDAVFIVTGGIVQSASGSYYENALMHADYSILAAGNGKHVFLEKPISSSLEEADRIVKAVKDTDIKFQLGFCFEYSPTVEKARQYMPDPAYSVCQCAGSLTGQACHNIDLIVHKFHQSQLIEVFASGGNYLDSDKHLPIDSFSAIFKFEDGSTSSYVQHGTMNPSLNKFQFQLFGSEGCVFLSDRFQDVSWYPVEGKPSDTYRDEQSYMGHQQEVEDWIDCIRTDRIPLNTAERGRYVLAVEKAIIESAMTGKVIQMRDFAR